jgi:hypothetical protein
LQFSEYVRRVTNFIELLNTKFIWANS